MKTFLSATAMTALLLAGAAQASQYKYVLVHGFQPSQLQDKPGAGQVSMDGEDYWREYWLAHASARLDWPSHERLQQKIATDYLWPKLQQLSRDGTCQSGCILVTHSTGDLVSRFLLENQANWLRSAGLQPLNIVATFDFAGAGGGSELADLAVNVADGKGGALVKAAVRAWLGHEPNRANIGVLNDLQVNVARQLVPSPQNRVPRVRFVAGGSDYLGTTSAFLPGTDDGVVASHSACGAATAGSFGSCNSQIALDGKVSNQSDAVRAFLPNHLPLLMAADYSHSATIGSTVKGRFSPAATSVRYGNGVWQLQTFDRQQGWPFKSTYRYVTGSELALSTFVRQVAL